MEPKHLRNWLIIIGLLYLILPRDLIPDFFGRGIGLIDDLLVMAGLSYFYRKRLRDPAARTTGLATSSENTIPFFKMTCFIWISS